MSETRFRLTEQHITLLRHAVVSWDPAEAGAPTLDPHRPLGGDDLYADIRRIAGTEADPLELHLDLELAFGIALHAAELTPGRYDYEERLAGMPTNTETCDIRVEDLARRYLPDGARDPRPGARCSFEFHARHREILQHASIRWNDRPGWPNAVPGIDPKRPYDDNCYVEFALAMIVGMPVDEEADRPISAEVETEMLRLHLSTQEAVQLLLQHGELEPGTYVLRDGIWRADAVRRISG